MAKLFKVAWRNVLRNKRRSFLSLVIILFGVAVLFVVKGYITASFYWLKIASVSKYGNFQIAQTSYWENKDDERHLLSKAEIETIQNILSRTTGVTNFSSQLAVSGIMGTEKRSTIISGIGIELSKAKNDNLEILSGTNLFDGDTNQVLIGKGVKQKLSVEDGEIVSLMVSTIDGAYNADNLQISGSFTTGITDADNVYVMIPLDFVQNLLNTSGVDKIIVYLKDVDQTEVTIRALQSQFTEAGLKVRMKSWLDLDTMYRQLKGFFQTVFFFMAGVILILVFFGIIEIMSMAFFERMREIGTVRAIGTKQYQVFTMLIEEGLILGIIGGLFGLLVGIGIGKVINLIHITYIPPASSQPVPLYIDLALSNGFVPFLLVVIATFISPLYPALKASRLNIVEILRHL